MNAGLGWPGTLPGYLFRLAAAGSVKRCSGLTIIRNRSNGPARGHAGLALPTEPGPRPPRVPVPCAWVKQPVTWVCVGEASMYLTGKGVRAP